MPVDYIGLLNICKLPGMSSHEVVSRVRRLADMKRVGHAGTLDPSACGVLVVCLGPATRLSDYIGVGRKAYRAELTFGITTDSADAEGAIIGQADASGLREEEVIAAMPQFTGTFQQRPPVHSAIWIDGRRAYQMARQGEEMEMPMREVTIDVFTPVRFQPGPRARLLADITCAKGTYIRSLAHDLGQVLGVGATLSFLARTRIGDFHIDDAVTLDELETAAIAGQFDRYLLPADTPIMSFPEIRVPASPATEQYRLGNQLKVEAEPGLYRVYLDERFSGLGRVEKGLLRPTVNFR